MRIISPAVSQDRIDNEIRKNDSKGAKWLDQQKRSITEVKKYRLHYQSVPVGMVVSAHPMEANAWNRNARAYFAYQITLGRELLPLLEWKECADCNNSMVWKVVYKNNMTKSEMLVSADSAAAAKRQFNEMAPVTAVIVSIEQDKDVVGAVQAARAMNEQVDDEFYHNDEQETQD